MTHGEILARYAPGHPLSGCPGDLVVVAANHGPERNLIVVLGKTPLVYRSADVHRCYKCGALVVLTGAGAANPFPEAPK